MKIKLTQLRRIIKEEVQKVIFEEIDPNCPECGGTGKRQRGTERNLGSEDCYLCNSENKSTCLNCGGDGVDPYGKKCLECDGTGQVDNL